MNKIWNAVVLITLPLWIVPVTLVAIIWAGAQALYVRWILKHKL